MRHITSLLLALIATTLSPLVHLGQAESIEERISHLELKDHCQKDFQEVGTYIRGQVDLKEGPDATNYKVLVAKKLADLASTLPDLEDKLGCYSHCETFSKLAERESIALTSQSKGSAIYYGAYCEAQRLRYLGLVDPENLFQRCRSGRKKRATDLLNQLGVQQFIQKMERVTELTPCLHHAGPYRNLGYLYSLMCEKEKSHQNYELAATRCSAHDINQCLLAKSYLEMGKQIQAEPFVKNCLESTSMEFEIQVLRKKISEINP